ncbi:hypothetical protein X975_26140, partial [Stegodyphus mimosarum]
MLGVPCHYKCKCYNGGTCQTASGLCKCPPGFIEPLCTSGAFEFANQAALQIFQIS